MCYNKKEVDGMEGLFLKRKILITASVSILVIFLIIVFFVTNREINTQVNNEKKIDKISYYLENKNYEKAYRIADRLRVNKKEKEEIKKIIEQNVKNELSEKPKHVLKEQIGTRACLKGCTKQEMIHYLLIKLRAFSESGKRDEHKKS